MTQPAGEMPFLDHLEELRWRILRSLAAVIVAFALGLFLVERFELVTVMKEPIAPYLQGGKLTVLSPTEPIKIVLQLGFILGLVLASPVILWQVWAFMAPALYEREKRAMVPALFVGAGLFLTGAVLAYVYVVPQALRVLFSFQSEAITPMITYGAYFDFVLQIVLALGLSFELPLIIIILAALGVVTPLMLHRFRRFAVVGAFIAGAILSPGADILSMLMMTVPLLVLYEIGVFGATMIHRRRVRRAAMEAGVALLLLALGAGSLEAQIGRPPGAGGDTTRAARARPAAGQTLDTAQARRLGIPSAPSREFAPSDSALDALLARPGYRATRFRADSATLFAEDDRIQLQGSARVDRQGITLEADSVGYAEQACELSASGAPRLFEDEQVVVGTAIRYNTCDRRGVISGALTTFEEGGTVWFLRGNVSHDSSASRIFAGTSEITSCDLPVAHYHFAAKKVKWVSQTTMAAQGLVLYVRDVPIIWLPFIFQDTRPGRRSGILPGSIGIGTLVRTGTSTRQLNDFGYYWAINDLFDAQATFDWVSGQYVEFDLSGRYNVLDRFVRGSAGVSRRFATDGRSSLRLQWNHQQQFNVNTSLRFDADYLTNSEIIDEDAIDPRVNIGTIRSNLTFSKGFRWGRLDLGGSRTQNVNDSLVDLTFPTLTLTPREISIGRNASWRPSMRFQNNTKTDQQVGGLFLQVRPGGGLDTLERVADSRTTTFNLTTPLTVAGFTWNNSLDVIDASSTSSLPGSVVDTLVLPNDVTPDPTDSIVVRRGLGGSFETGVDWQTSVNLPTVFRGSWRLQPRVGVANALSSRPFALRNERTDGDFVTQKKRFFFGATSNPTFFGFINAGLGPFSRFRHSLTPNISWQYAPSSSVPEAFVRAAGLAAPELPAQHQVALGLSQTLEAKGRPEPGDTLGTENPNIRKYRLLSVTTSPIAYDFEQAKLPGRTGWVTPQISNTILSDLVPGLNLSVTHDLWRGVVGTDTADFDPFLSRVDAGFSISSNTFRGIASLLGLGGPRERETGRSPDRNLPGRDAEGRLTDRFGGETDFTGRVPFSQRRPEMMGGQGFQAQVRYSLQRVRPVEPPVSDAVQRPTQQSIQLNTQFAPTRFWRVGWSTQYNVTDKRFESHSFDLERDLHEWRARFSFVQNPNGNNAFFFSIWLTDLPDLKLDINNNSFGG